MNDRKYDLVVLGASGFTGRHVLGYVSRAAKEEGMRWAAAGRSKAKVEEALAEASLTEQGVEVIVCDIRDELSLRDMAQSTRAVLNCVGPYIFTGEAVVKACVDAGTHHLDVSGEPLFLEKTQLSFDDSAQEKGVYVVGACGFDSIPSDLGLSVVHQAMGGPVNSVEMYTRFETAGAGPGINYGTWQSVVRGLANMGKLPALRRMIHPEALPQINPGFSRKGMLHKSDAVDGKRWCLLFPGSDRSVMVRSERMRYRHNKTRPSRVAAYVEFPTFLRAALTLFMFVLLTLMARFRLGIYLLETFPGLFSLGKVAKGGLSKEAVEGSSFSMKLIGLGWPGENEGSLSIATPPNRRVEVTVKGMNVGYGATCECLVQSAVVLLKEGADVPGHGGVLTPGYAFGNTTLVERLHRRGVTFNTEVKSI